VVEDMYETTLGTLVREAGELVSRLEALLHSADPVALVRTDSVPADPPTARAVSTRYRLTRRESHVVELLLLGLSNRQIARTMLIAEATVKNHLHSIFGKLGVADRTQAVAKVLQS